MLGVIICELLGSLLGYKGQFSALNVAIKPENYLIFFCCNKHPPKQLAIYNLMSRIDEFTLRYWKWIKEGINCIARGLGLYEIRQLLQHASHRQEEAEIGVDSAKIVENVEIGAVAWLGFSMWRPDVATIYPPVSMFFSESDTCSPCNHSSPSMYVFLRIGCLRPTNHRLRPSRSFPRSLHRLHVQICLRAPLSGPIVNDSYGTVVADHRFTSKLPFMAHCDAS